MLLTPEEEQLAAEIFGAALGLSGAAREELLRARCGESAAVRREVEELLAAAEGAGPLDRPGPRPTLVGALAGAGLVLDSPLPVGGRLGQYTVLEVLGSGGMGVVYRAAQHRPQRTVALKVIRQGYADPDLLRRFELEAEMLGRLHHPGVAQIYEAGLADAGLGPQPFFAMELVDGPSLTVYAERERLGTRARVQLVARLCEAVEHAHRKGVIHRDLKPANVLVTEGGQPKVLDFGVARATDRRGATLATTAGQLVGTLPYMSPEQVVGDPDQIDTRTDVYALGVILYELLTGRLPHNLEGRSVPEAARIIRDEEPRALRVVAPALRGELDVITHKAMARDKVRRYPSAGALGEELGRYLAGEPIEARRDSAVYVLRKQARKHRVVVAAAAVVLVLLVASTILSSVQSGRNAALARDRAEALKETRASLEEAERQRARADLELWVSQVERGRLTARMGSFAQAEARLWSQHLARPEQALGRWALWELYSGAPSLVSRPMVWSPTDALAFSPDGATLVVGGRITDPPDPANEGKAPLDLWDSDLKGPPRRLLAHAQDLTAVAFSRDGAVLASADFTGTVRLWRMPGALPGISWAASPRAVRCVAFSGDGLRLLTTGESKERRGTACTWDVATGARVAEFVGHANRVDAAVFVPGGRVLSADWDGAVCLWDGATGRLVGQGAAGLLRCSGVVMRDATHGVVAGSMESGGSGVVEVELPGPGGGPLRVGTVRAIGAGISGALSIAGGGGLVTGGKGVTVVPPEGPAVVLGEDSGENYIAAAAPTGGRIASASATGGLRLWEARTHGAMASIPGLTGDLTAACFLPGGRLIVLAGEAGLAFVELRGPVGDEAGTVIVAKLAFEGEVVARCAAMPDGASVVVALDPREGGGSSRVALIDLRTGREVWSTSLEAGVRCGAMEVARGGTRILLGGSDGIVRVFSGVGERIMTSAVFRRGVAGLAASPDGASVAIAENFQGVSAWDLSGAAVPVGEWRTGSYAVAYSPDGRWLARSDWYGRLESRGEDGGVVGYVGHTRSVRALAFSPDSTTMFSAGHDRTVRVWEVASGQNLTTLAWADWSINALALSPDGTWLVAAGDGGHAAVYDLLYYDRHIAGQEGAFRLRLGKKGGAAGPAGGPAGGPARGEPPGPWPRRNDAPGGVVSTADLIVWSMSF